MNIIDWNLSFSTLPFYMMGYNNNDLNSFNVRNHINYMGKLTAVMFTQYPFKAINIIYYKPESK